MEWSTAEISAKLSQFSLPVDTFVKVEASPLAEYRQSAVLVPLFIKEGQIHVLLTLRSTRLKRHKGEVSFPGGMRDVGDADEIETCLREAEEEIGLKRENVTILGKLPIRITRHKTLIIPVVGMIPNDFTPIPNTDEVEDVFTLPLERFLSDKKHNSQKWQETLPNPVLIHFFEDKIKNKTFSTWGLTANMAIELAVALLQKRPQFTYQIDHQMSIEKPFLYQTDFLERILLGSNL